MLSGKCWYFWYIHDASLSGQFLLASNKQSQKERDNGLDNIDVAVLLLEKQSEVLQSSKTTDDLALVNEDNVNELRIRLHENEIATSNELTKQRYKRTCFHFP